MRNSRRLGLAAGLLLLASALVFLLPRDSGAQGSNAASVGEFGPAQAEPTIGPGAGYPRTGPTSAVCIDRSNGQPPTGPPGTSPNLPPPVANPTGPGLTRGFIDCKPTAGSQSVLASGKVVYWDNLAGTENVELSIASEYGVVGLNDQTRLMDPTKLSGPNPQQAWQPDPSPIDGGAPNANQTQPLVPGQLFSTNQTGNTGSLFCSGQVFLADGRLLATGGTKYRNDPGNDQTKFGSTELEGIPNTRIYDPTTNTWSQTQSMHFGRWYGTPVTLDDNSIFEVSGLRRLIKPANTAPQPGPNDRPADPSRPLTQPLGYSPGYGVQEGQNERMTETRSPDGNWVAGPDSARQTLPLFARIHLLPDNHVFYDAGGQSFNPAGQAYDEALWNMASSYDPASKRWTDLGLPGQNAPPPPGSTTPTIPGFIGSTFSVMMPLKPNANGKYTKASFLVAGGVPNPPSPGGYFAIKQSMLHTVDTAAGRNHDKEQLTSARTGDLATGGAFGRWYSSGTLLPDGEVLATSGADRDEVALPGFEIPQTTAELFNPMTNTWRQVAQQKRARTYHNTANLLKDGTVLVGGHAIISNGYLANRTLLEGQTAPNGPVGRDPTFEIYKPPYMFCPGKQATVLSVSERDANRRRTIKLDVPASSIESVVAIRHGAVTHIVDADQRSVMLPIVARSGNTLTVQEPAKDAVMPAGPYMYFANRRVGTCLKPSIAGEVMVAKAKKKARHARRHHRKHRRPHARFTG